MGVELRGAPHPKPRAGWLELPSPQDGYAKALNLGIFRKPSGLKLAEMRA